MISNEEAAKRMGVVWHSISFSETFKKGEGWTWDSVAAKLKQYDPDLQVKEVSIFENGRQKA